MKSMTGFGSASAKINNFEVNIEITAVNRRILEVQTSLPREWQSLESKISTAARSHVARGKLNIYVQVSDHSNNSPLLWNELAIESSLNQIKEFSLKHSIPYQPNSELVLSVAKLIGTSSDLPNPTSVETALLDILNSALKNLVSMRENEGATLKTDVQQRIKILSSYISSIKDSSKDTLPHYKEQMLNRLKDANLNFDLSDERILKEISLFVDRSDISEEIIRLNSHLDQFLSNSQSNEAVGRKLDFICQEINRELNTIASKSNLIDITNNIIDAKNELERIREQIQNVE